MPVVREPVNGGLVTVRHPTLLRPGELQQCDDLVLYPGDPSIRTAPGRTAYAAVRTTDISSTTNGTTTLTSSAAFGTDIASVVVTAGSNIITKGGAGLSALVKGQTVVGTGIPAGTVVREVIDTNTVELSKQATAGGTVTITISDLHPGTFITGIDVTAGTYIASITNASTLIMSAAATGSQGPITRTFSEQVQGLRALKFEDGSDLLVAKAADKLYTSPLTAVTGTFTALYTGLSQDADAYLESISHGDRHILLTGFNAPRLLYYKDVSGTSTPFQRALGMKVVNDFGGASVIQGSWSSLADFQNGYYYFLVTEVFNAGQPDEVESTFEATRPDGSTALKYARITDYANQSIQIVRNPTTNASGLFNDGTYGSNLATHWRVYMSPKQTEPLPLPDLSTFRRVAEATVQTDGSQDSITLSDTNKVRTGWASTATTYSSKPTLFPSGATNALSGQAAQSLSCSINQTTNPTTVTSSALFANVAVGMEVTGTGIPVTGTPVTVIAKASSSSITISQPVTTTGTVTLRFSNKPSWDSVYALAAGNDGDDKAAELGSFGITAATDTDFAGATITGVRVELRSRYSVASGSDRGFWVSIGKSSSGTYSAERWITDPIPRENTPRILSSGSQFDTWGVSFSVANLYDLDFVVRLRNHASAVPITHYIDGIKVTVYAGGNTINLDGEAFRTISLSDQIGNAFSIGANGSPPLASTGDVFEGMVLLDNGPGLRASLPDEIDAYPSAYELPFPDNDPVKVVRRLGNGCIVGGIGTIKRLNYFPKETDAEFSRGKCFEYVTKSLGMVGPRSARVLDMPGRGSVMAFLSHSGNGLQWTDGITTSPLNEDIDWINLIEPTLIQRSVLEVYPKLWLLALYYVPAGGTRKTKVMYFSYHPMHIKEGFKLPAVGPVSCESGAAATILLNGVPRLFTGNARDGKVYVEDSGTADGSGGSISPALKSRRFIAAEVGAAARVERIFAVMEAAGNATTGGFTAVLSRQDQGEAVTEIDTKTEDTATGGLIELFPDNVVETFDIKLSKSGVQTAAMRVHYLAYEVVAPVKEQNAS